MLLVCLLIAQKKSSGRTSDMLPLEGDSLHVKCRKKIEWRTTKALFLLRLTWYLKVWFLNCAWSICDCWDTTTLFNAPYFFKKLWFNAIFLARKRQRFCIQQQGIIRIKVERQGSLRCFNQMIVFCFHLFQKTWTQSSSCKFSLLVAST